MILLLSNFGSERLVIEKNLDKTHNRNKDFIVNANINTDISKEELLALAEEIKKIAYTL